MQYTIEGFNQAKAVELGLDTDDLVILRWLINFSSKMEKKEIEGNTFYWVNYKKLLEDIPILKFKSKDRLYRKLKNLVDKNILIHKNLRDEGNFSYYGFGKNYSKLITNTQENNITLKELADNFDKIWQIYPRKDGKNMAFNHYKAWLKGRIYAGRMVKLDNKQMWYATKKYADLVTRNKIEKQYIKMGSTFFNDGIMEYVEVN